LSPDFFKKVTTSKISYGTEEIKDKIKTGDQSNTIFFIGPEGGYSNKEIDIFNDNNFTFVKFHTNILRTETAAIYIASKYK
jgi:16S rRNA (uracil1498-N3)-methyltransferase